MEIWQNSPNDCIDPSLITLAASGNAINIVLPPNTTLDQFQIEYKISLATNWYQVSSTTLYLSYGYSYQLRVRAKCYLAFTDYHYMNFVTDCVNTSAFSISSIGNTSVTLSSYNLSDLEVQYALAGNEQWENLSQYTNQILNLLPGTSYSLRYRGRCPLPSTFSYMQFTTLCPKLSQISLTTLRYNEAQVSWTSSYTGNATLEYSGDNNNWTLIDETQTIFPLTPGKKYFLRGRLTCTNINSDFIYTSFTTPCPEVSMLRADAVTPFSATINWADESDTKSYTLTYTTSGAVKTVETNSTSFNLQGLTPGTKYTVTVAPKCIAAKNFTAITFSTVCYVPFNLSANEITQTTAELSWSDNFNGSPYSIDYSISGSNDWQTKEATLTNISLAELRPGTEYEARVHITCLSETAPYVSVLFETNLYQETAFAPNPTDREITIFPSKNLIGNSFVIFDNAGRQVANAELLDYTINLSILPPGIYTLKIEGEKLMKIIKH